MNYDEVARMGRDLFDRSVSILTKSSSFKAGLLSHLQARVTDEDDMLQRYYQEFIANYKQESFPGKTLEDAVFEFVTNFPNIEKPNQFNGYMVPTVIMLGPGIQKINIGIASYKIDGFEPGYRYISFDVRYKRQYIKQIKLETSQGLFSFGYEDDVNLKILNSQLTFKFITEFLDTLDI